MAALSELTDTVCVVVRYFGGIKLGAGGLIRAYGGAARQVIQTADIQVCIPQTTIGITVDAAFVGVIYEMAAKYGVWGPPVFKVWADEFLMDPPCIVTFFGYMSAWEHHQQKQATKEGKQRTTKHPQKRKKNK